MIYLLDLNFTLVANSHVKATPFVDQIMGEVYSMPLIEKLKEHTVILISARPEKYKAMTVDNIQAQTGWKPDNVYFNEPNLPPAHAKKFLLERYVLPEISPNDLFGIESNPKTRQMYADLGISSCTMSEFMVKK